MSLDAKRVDLQAMLRDRASRAYAARVGRAASEPSAELLEKLPDLVAPEVILELVHEAEAEEPAGPRWQMLAAALELAVSYRVQGAQQEARTRLAEIRLPWADEEVPFALFEPLLAASTCQDRELLRPPMERGAAEVASLEAELVAPRREAASALGIGNLANPWERARGLSATELQRQAARLLQATDGEYRDAAALERGRLLGRSTAVHWCDMPAFLRGHAEAGLPAPGVDLVRFVAQGLGLDASLAARVSFDLEGRRSKLPGAHVRAAMQGKVQASWRPLGGMTDYRGVLRCLGLAIPEAFRSETMTAACGVRAPIADTVGALLEVLVRDPGWYERAFLRPPGEAVVRHAGLGLWLRMRQLAATVVAGGSGPDAALRVPTPPEEAARATGFEHPEGLLPWTPAWGEAADELAGWLAAPVLADRLATRFGTAWMFHSGAGRSLRDLCLAEIASVGDLCSELGVAFPEIEPLLDLWRPGVD